MTAKKEGTFHPRCTVKPDAGEERSFFAWDVTSKLRSKGAQLDPWFAGAAMVTCERVSGERASVRTGSMAHARLFFANTLNDLLIAVAAAAPIFLGLRVGRRR